MDLRDTFRRYLEAAEWAREHEIEWISPPFPITAPFHPITDDELDTEASWDEIRERLWETIRDADEEG